MTGVTIINSFEIYEIADWQFIIGITPLVLSGLISFIMLIKGIKPDLGIVKKFIASSHLSVLVGGLISCVLVFVFNYACPAEYVETQYEVSIDDTAAFNAVYDKYNIIEEKENTFIVVERQE